MSLRDKRDNAQKEYGLLGKFWKFPEGTSKVRILVEPVYYTFVGDDGKRKPQWITYFLIRGATREDDHIVAAYIPAAFIDWIADTLEEDEDFGFQEYPMPYDIKVMATGSGLQRRYEKNALPIKAENQVTEEQLAELAGLPKITDVADEREARVEPKKAVQGENLPAEVVKEHNERQSKRNKVEVDPMFMRFEGSITKAQDTGTLNKIAAQIGEFTKLGTMDEFMASMLMAIIENRVAKLNPPAGGGEEDINVEDIPF